MNKFLLFLVAVFSLVSCSLEKEPPKDTDILQQNLKGKVQTIEETSFPVDSTGVAGAQDSLFTINEYTEIGYQTKAITKDINGRIKTEQTITRHENGMFKELVTKTDGKETFKLSTELDEKGTGFKGAKTFDSTGKQDSYYSDIKVNEYGIVYSARQFKMDGTPKSAFETKYDKYIYQSGKGTDSAGRTTYEGWVKSNEKADAIEEYAKTLNGDSTKEETTFYKYDSYDEKGNWTQRTTSNQLRKPTKITKRKFTYYKD